MAFWELKECYVIYGRVGEVGFMLGLQLINHNVKGGIKYLRCWPEWEVCKVVISVLRWGSSNPDCLSAATNKQKGSKQTFGDPGVNGDTGGDPRVDWELTVGWFLLSAPALLSLRFFPVLWSPADWLLRF